MNFRSELSTYKPHSSAALERMAGVRLHRAVALGVGGRERTESSEEAGAGTRKSDWADDATTTNCFLTDAKFTMTNRKHHCRYCGQIFVADVCKKTTRIPSAGFIEPVRVCDICFDQLERGDPVCISKQVAAMRSDSATSQMQGAKALGG